MGAEKAKEGKHSLVPQGLLFLDQSITGLVCFAFDSLHETQATFTFNTKTEEKKWQAACYLPLQFIGWRRILLGLDFHGHVCRFTGCFHVNTWRTKLEPDWKQHAYYSSV